MAVIGHQQGIAAKQWNSRRKIGYTLEEDVQRTMQQDT